MNDSIFKMNLRPGNIKYFIYNNERYPFDYDLLKRSSPYISNNDQFFKTETNIDLVNDQSIKLSAESITNFINCCEGKEFHVNDSNVFDLHFLSVQYEVAYLQNIAKRHISDHQDLFALESLLNKERLGINDATLIESIISENLLTYVNKDEFLLLDIPDLHRLIKRYTDLGKPINESLVNFLFKCLDKYGKEASYLFSLIDFEHVQMYAIDRLLSEPYRNIFDFTFINSSLLKTTKDISSELSRMKIEYSQELSAMKQLFGEFVALKKSLETKFIPQTTSISLTPKINEIKTGEEVTLKAVVEPENAIKIIKWSVSDDRLQIKNSNVGECIESQIVLRGIRGGESTLTATTVDGSNIQLSVNISVIQQIQSITLNPNISSIIQNEEVKITANVEPKGALNKNVRWKINGNGIEMKDLSGKSQSEVTGREIILRGTNEGVSTLTVTAEDGSNVQYQTSITTSNVNLLKQQNRLHRIKLIQ